MEAFGIVEIVGLPRRVELVGLDQIEGAALEFRHFLEQPIDIVDATSRKGHYISVIPAQWFWSVSLYVGVTTY